MRERHRGRGRTVAGAAVLVALVLAVYIPALSAGYVWDDDALLTANPNVRTLEGLGRTWGDPQANTDYYPLTHTSFWVEYHLWRLAPLGYHLDNILLHAANAVLVWLILRRLAVPGAWVAAAIFAVHPVQVEAVAWVSERKSVLGGLFCLLSVWLFLRVTLTGDDLSTRRWRLLYGLSLACFALALLARPVVMAAAVVLPLLVWYKRGRLTWGEGFRIAWYWVLAAIVTPVTIWVQYTHVGAAGESFNYSALERVLIAGRVLWFYLGKLVWPYPLIFCYDKWPIDAGAWWQYLYPGSVVAALAALILLRRRIGLGPLVGALVFAIILSPALGFFNVYWHLYYFVADHMQYLACVGLIALAVAGAAAAATRLGTWAQPVSWAIAAALLGLFGALTWQQCGIYQDDETVWNDTLRKNPNSWMALNNRGRAYFHKKDYDRAIRDFDLAIHLKPDHAKAYNNRGNAYNSKGQYDAAIKDLDKAIELKPDVAEAYNNRGIAYYGKGQYDAAIKDCDKAIGLKPDFVEAYNNRGNAYNSKGQYDAAIKDYDKAIELKSDYAEAYNNRGNVLNIKGQYDAAIKDYDKAIGLEPNSAEAYNNRGNTFQSKGQYDAAIKDYDKAIELKLDYAEAYYNRGNTFQSKGQYDAAIKDYDKAIELEPDYAEAYNNRGNVLNIKGQYDAAIKDCDKAIELKPDYAEAYYNRGNTFQSKGQYDAAIKDYDKAIGLKPDFVEAYNNRGNAYNIKGQYDAAIKDYDKAIGLKPDFIEAYQNRAVAHCLTKAYDKAWADVKMYRKLGGTPHPKFIEALTRDSGRSE